MKIFFLNFLGIISYIAVSLSYSFLQNELLEAMFWFSEISLLEKEISFRTEQGLYYSYFKQLIDDKNIFSGIRKLTNDNITEYPSVINIFHRMNILPELWLGSVYHILQTLYPLFSLEPILFYIWNVFALQAILLASLAIISWKMGSSWVGGFLTMLLYAALSTDTTRVRYTIPLRESFALPFFWLKIAIAVFILDATDSNRSPQRKFTLKCCHVVSNAVFCLSWQFNQFILLLEGISLFALGLINLVALHNILYFLISNILVLLITYALQFFNHMIITSLGLWFSIYSFILLYLFRNYVWSAKSIAEKLVFTLLLTVICFSLCVASATLLKTIISEKSDSHVFRFLLLKLGLSNKRDFDSQLYLCVSSFDWLPWQTIIRLSTYGMFPFYVVCHTTVLILMIWQAFGANLLHDFCTKWSFVSMVSPAMSFITMNAILFAGLAVTTMRMKYLWTPFICILFSVGLTHSNGVIMLFLRWLHKCYHGRKQKLTLNVTLQSKVALKKKEKHKEMNETTQFSTKVPTYICWTITIAYLSLWIAKYHSETKAELTNLREFYDPDTVDLMKWIQKSTLKTDSFTGSMQLMAAIKLCTGRPILNHPHYENMKLRDKTKELYKMYGRYSTVEVWHVMKEHAAKFMVVEDSICLNYGNECSMSFLLELEKNPEITLSQMDTSKPLFCDNIRRLSRQGPKTKYFRLVFINKTFRVYEVLY